MSALIPANIDHAAIIADLNARGLRDFKIETICGFSIGYVAQLKCGGVKQMSYQRAARLYNFWLSEVEDPRGTLPIHIVTATAT
jgi:hypothetical protein